MRVVLDSNVFFSALITPSGPPFLAIQAWLEGSFELVTSRQQIEELQRVSRYKKLRLRFAPHEIGEIINEMKPYIFTRRIPPKHTCQDPDDAYLLDLTDISGADYLVTGDRRSGLLERQRVGRASILTAKAFAARLSL